MRKTVTEIIENLWPLLKSVFPPACILRCVGFVRQLVHRGGAAEEDGLERGSGCRAACEEEGRPTADGYHKILLLVIFVFQVFTKETSQTITLSPKYKDVIQALSQCFWMNKPESVLAHQLSALGEKLLMFFVDDEGALLSVDLFKLYLCPVLSCHLYCEACLCALSPPSRRRQQSLRLCATPCWIGALGGEMLPENWSDFTVEPQSCFRRRLIFIFLPLCLCPAGGGWWWRVCSRERDLCSEGRDSGGLHPKGGGQRTGVPWSGPGPGTAGRRSSWTHRPVQAAIWDEESTVWRHAGRSTERRRGRTGETSEGSIVSEQILKKLFGMLQLLLSLVTFDLQAFGVGALEDDDDEEVYHRDSMSRYDKVLGGEEPGDGLYGWTAPQQYTKKKGEKNCDH